MPMIQISNNLKEEEELQTLKRLENYLDIELFGEMHRFRTNLESSRAKTVLNHLRKEVSKVQAQMPNSDAEAGKVIILTAVALNIANENFELKNHNSKFEKKIENRSEDLIRILDKSIAGA